MSSLPAIFNHDEFGEIRTALIKNEPYLMLNDVCRILELNNVSQVKTRLNKDGVTTNEVIDNLCRKQEATFINEANFYKVIFQSRKPEAEKFTDWVAGEVLPTIRKHGAYITPNTLEQMITSPEFGIKLLTALQEEQAKNKQLQVINSALSVDKQIMQPKADYFDELVDRNLLTSFRDTAKQFEIKEKDFIGFLTTKRFIYRDKKGKLMPYAEKNNGLFEVKECFNERTNWTGTQTLITPKGRETFRLLLIKSA